MRTSVLDDFKLHVVHSSNTLNHLLAINIAAFVLFKLLWVILQLFTINALPYERIINLFYFPSSPVAFLFKPWTLITYQFMHAGFFHLLFNMIMLYFAGRIFREYLGDKKLLSVYLIGGICGAVLFMLAYQFFPLFAQARSSSVVLGASASVLAVLTAAGTLLPRYTVHLMFLGPVRLVYIVLFLVVVDFLSLAGGNAGGSFAHLGGVIWGFTYIKTLQSGTDLGAWLNNLLDKIKGLFTRRRPKPKINYYNENPRIKKPGKRVITQEEVDLILDKIAQSGYDSLTQHEKDVLFQASKEN